MKVRDIDELDQSKICRYLTVKYGKLNEYGQITVDRSEICSQCPFHIEVKIYDHTEHVCINSRTLDRDIDSSVIDNADIIHWYDQMQYIIKNMQL